LLFLALRDKLSAEKKLREAQDEVEDIKDSISDKETTFKRQIGSLELEIEDLKLARDAAITQKEKIDQQRRFVYLFQVTNNKHIHIRTQTHTTNTDNWKHNTRI
jgi:hypothetical protein